MDIIHSTRRLSWVLIIALPLLVGACGKKNTDITPSAPAIQGSWRFSTYTIDPAYDLLGTGTKSNDLLPFLAFFIGTDITDCFKSTTLTFGTDGKLIGSSPARCNVDQTNPVGSSATWSLNGSKLRVVGVDTNDYDIVISGNTLKLSQKDTTTDYDYDGKNDIATLTLTLTKV